MVSRLKDIAVDKGFWLRQRPPKPKSPVARLGYLHFESQEIHRRWDNGQVRNRCVQNNVLD
jgi:hypothetical protein